MTPLTHRLSPRSSLARTSSVRAADDRGLRPGQRRPRRHHTVRSTLSEGTVTAAATHTVLNPATEEPIAELPAVDIEEADAAVATAKEAFPGWRAVAPADRARLLRRLAGLVEEHTEELARIESENVG